MSEMTEIDPKPITTYTHWVCVTCRMGVERQWHIYVHPHHTIIPVEELLDRTGYTENDEAYTTD